MNKAVITVFGICGYSVFMEVDRFHKDGETIVAKQIHEEIGAKGFNQALASARQGAKVNFVFALGSDLYSRKVLKDLKNYPVKCFVEKKKGKSPFACILTNAQGDNQVTVYPGVRLDHQNFNISKYEKLIKESTVVLLQLEIPNEINFEIINLCKKHGVKVILNPAPASNFLSEYLDFDILLTPNESEAKEILGLDNLEDDKLIVQACLEKKINQLIITLGAKGVLVYDEKISIIKAPKVKVLDSTGAGDVFNGVLASSIAGGMSLSAAVVSAVQAASLSVTKKYVLNAIPTLEDLGK